MPVTSFRSTSVAPGRGPAAPPSVAAMPADGAVGHGVTRLMARPPAHGQNGYIPGAAPPRGETAGAHGAHKGRISIR